ncbi:hypothetical protein CPC08DRAFT_649275, partial [Agrocybe pediades]
MTATIPPDAEELLLPSPKLSVLELINFDFPSAQPLKHSPWDAFDFFDRADSDSISLVEIQSISIPSLQTASSLLQNMPRAMQEGFKSVRCHHSDAFKQKTYPLWIINYWTASYAVRSARDRWRCAENYIQNRLSEWKKKESSQSRVALIHQILDTLDSTPWSTQLQGFSKDSISDDGFISLTCYASKEWLKGEHMNQMLDLLR